MNDGRTPINDLKPGRLDSTLLIGKAESANTRTGKPYMRYTFMDATGSVTGVDWSPTSERRAFQPGDVVRVEGKYEVDATYGPQVVVKELSQPLSFYEESDFAASCPNDMERVNLHFDDLLDACDQPYADFLRRVLDPGGGKTGAFWRAPAAAHLHQAYTGGLAEHSVQVADIAFMTSGWCPGLDETVLVAAGLLHDIGKLLEYSGPAREQTRMAKLVGNTALSHHIVCQLLGEEVAAGRQQADQRMEHIKHCVIAHHGRREWGSPVTPQTMEAWLIHLADMMSARIGGYQRLVESTEGEWTSRDLMFDGSLWLPKQAQPSDFQNPFTFL